MARKTKAQIEAERQAANREAERVAFRWTDEIPAPDLPVPRPGMPMISGWHAFASLRCAQAERAWSKSFCHGYGEAPSLDRTASQHGIPLYSTRELAWKAARAMYEREAARMLLRIDHDAAREE